MAAAIPLLSRCTYGSTPGRLDGPAYFSGAGMLDVDPVDLLRAYVAVRVEVEGRPAIPILDDMVAALDRCGRRHRDDRECVHVVGRIRRLATAEARRLRRG